MYYSVKLHLALKNHRFINEKPQVLESGSFKGSVSSWEYGRGPLGAPGMSGSGAGLVSSGSLPDFDIENSELH